MEITAVNLNQTGVKTLTDNKSELKPINLVIDFSFDKNGNLKLDKAKDLTKVSE